jgi:hypothetical protein
VKRLLASGPLICSARCFIQVVLICGSSIAGAQELAPRAYFITAVGSNAVTFTYTFSQGPVFVDPLLPIEDLKGSFQTQTLSYYHSLDFFGRSANLTVALPYATGNFEGTVAGVHQQVRRSGLADGRIRFAWNLYGGRAMPVREYVTWHEKTTIGTSLTVAVPTGQYDPARLINGGGNRWGVKPEIALTHRWGKWMLDLYGGVWIFGSNGNFYPGGSLRTQAPILNGEAHFGYYVKPRLWVSMDANYWIGGNSTVNGVINRDQQKNSRLGCAVAIPAGAHQSVKFSYSKGAYVSIGGNYSTVSASWQYSWLTKH